MGAWGPGPLDNDSAMDWVGDYRYTDGVTKAIPDGVWEDSVPEKAIKKALEDRGAYWEDDARAAAHVVARSKKHAKLKPLALKAMRELLEDSAWLDQWVNEEEVARAIRDQISELNGDPLKNYTVTITKSEHVTVKARSEQDAVRTVREENGMGGLFGRMFADPSVSISVKRAGG